MPFTVLLITFKEFIKDSMALLAKTEIGIPPKVDTYFIEDTHASKVALSKLIMEKKPMLIIFDARIGSSFMRELYFGVIRNSVLAHKVICEIYSFGETDFNLPGIYHYYPNFTPKS